MSRSLTFSFDIGYASLDGLSLLPHPMMMRIPRFAVAVRFCFRKMIVRHLKGVNTDV